MPLLSIFCRPEITVKRPQTWRACLRGKHLLPLFKLDFGGAAALFPIYGTYKDIRMFLVFIFLSVETQITGKCKLMYAFS